jgi:hypothetical protein
MEDCICEKTAGGVIKKVFDADGRLFFKKLYFDLSQSGFHFHNRVLLAFSAGDASGKTKYSDNKHHSFEHTVSFNQDE